MKIKHLSEKWKNLGVISRIAYIVVGTLFGIIVFEGIILETFFNVALIDYEIVEKLYIAAIVISLIAREWKLAVIAAIGGIVMLSIAIGISEFFGYYLREWRKFLIEL